MLRVKESVVVVQGPGNWRVIVAKKKDRSGSRRSRGLQFATCPQSPGSGSVCFMRRNGSCARHSRSEPIPGATVDKSERRWSVHRAHGSGRRVRDWRNEVAYGRAILVALSCCTVQIRTICAGAWLRAIGRTRNSRPASLENCPWLLGTPITRQVRS